MKGLYTNNINGKYLIYLKESDYISDIPYFILVSILYTTLFDLLVFYIK